MIRITLALIILCASTPAARAGGWRHRRVTVGGVFGPAMTGVPAWAAEAMRASPGPLRVPPGGRRPWAYALSHVNTPAARMALYYQTGGGAGPTAGYTNGPPSYFVPYTTRGYPYP
jgi:hypothetical protein